MLSKGKLRNIALCFVLVFGSLVGIPVQVERLEELLRAMTQPKIAHTLPDQDDNGDPPPTNLGGGDE